MTATAIERRGFLRAAGAGFAATLLPRQAEALAHTDAIFAAAYRSEGGSYGVALVAEDGREISRIALPDRGHDITHDPNSSHAVAFARRPGTFALVFDRSAGTPVTLIEAAEDRHFFGHGVYAPSGRLLYIAENDFDNYAGVIGLYDARSGYAKVGEFPAHGMDTHDVQLMEGGRYLAIANGGIRQHPDSGRIGAVIGGVQDDIKRRIPAAVVVGRKGVSSKRRRAVDQHVDGTKLGLGLRNQHFGLLRISEIGTKSFGRHPHCPQIGHGLRSRFGRVVVADGDRCARSRELDGNSPAYAVCAAGDQGDPSVQIHCLSIPDSAVG